LKAFTLEASTSASGYALVKRFPATCATSNATSKVKGQGHEITESSDANDLVGPTRKKNVIYISYFVPMLLVVYASK